MYVNWFYQNKAYTLSFAHVC